MSNRPDYLYRHNLLGDEMSERRPSLYPSIIESIDKLLTRLYGPYILRRSPAGSGSATYYITVPVRPLRQGEVRLKPAQEATAEIDLTADGAIKAIKVRPNHSPAVSTRSGCIARTINAMAVLFSLSSGREDPGRINCRILETSGAMVLVELYSVKEICHPRQGETPHWYETVMTPLAHILVDQGELFNANEEGCYITDFELFD